MDTGLFKLVLCMLPVQSRQCDARNAIGTDETCCYGVSASQPPQGTAGSILSGECYVAYTETLDAIQPCVQ